MTDPLWKPPQLTDSDHAFIAMAVSGGNVFVSPDTYLELRRRLSDYARFEVSLPERSPIQAGIRIVTDASMPNGRVYGPAGTSMSLDTFIPIITPRPEHG